MAITTDSVIDFFGTQDEVTATTPSAVTDGSMSVTADIIQWTNDDDAPEASAVIAWQYASGTINTNGFIALYARLMNIQSTNDESTVDASNKKHLIGIFEVDAGLATATDDTIGIDIELKNQYTSQVYEFYIENNTGVTISSGWSIWVTPKTVGPHA